MMCQAVEDEGAERVEVDPVDHVVDHGVAGLAVGEVVKPGDECVDPFAAAGVGQPGRSSGDVPGGRDGDGEQDSEHGHHRHVPTRQPHSTQDRAETGKDAHGDDRRPGPDSRDHGDLAGRDRNRPPRSVPGQDDDPDHGDEQDEVLAGQAAQDVTVCRLRCLPRCDRLESTAALEGGGGKRRGEDDQPAQPNTGDVPGMGPSRAARDNGGVPDRVGEDRERHQNDPVVDSLLRDENPIPTAVRERRLENFDPAVTRDGHGEQDRADVM
jgi:hypothetical protein